MDEAKGVEQNSPSALQAAIASSPEVEQEAQQTQETQTPATEEVTQEQETQQEESRVPYSRLKEVVDEKNWLKQQLELQLQQRQTQQQFQQPTQDPYANMTAEEEKFWRLVDDRARKVANQELQQVRPVIDAGRMELAQMKVAQFRNSHPDIKSNSQEEIQIAERIQSGYTPDDAYWSVMGPRGAKVAEKQGEQKFKQQIQAKKQANVESKASIPVQSQPQPKKSFRDEFLENYNKAEQGEI